MPIRTTTALAALALMSLSAATRADETAAPSPAPYNWSGAYVGGTFSADWGQSKWAQDGGGGGTASGTMGLGNPYDFFAGTGSYATGLSAGYDYQLPEGVVIGVASDISFPSLINGSATANGATQWDDGVLMSGTVRGRLGLALDRFLLYGTAGYAWAQEQATATDIASGNTQTRRPMRHGWVAGGGVEAMLGRNWSADLSYLYTDYGSGAFHLPDGTGFQSDITLQSVRMGLNYRFADGTDASTREQLSALTPSGDWAVHAQSTYVMQAVPGFRSPYIGAQSLIPNQQHQTWDVTLYLGRRLWQGAELWVNPEIDQGFGLSNTHGVAGFPSGEAYKVGASWPYARIPRYFIRDTISLGGKMETVEADANQFAGTQTENRLVFTVGKFGITDIFDTNQYAHDPRSDFLNWALVDTGTFDYAADPWGYTYGAAVEWYQGDWTLRVGIFDLSDAPNSTELDPNFSQFQTVAEIERRYRIHGQPGKIAITGFLSRGRMGTYTDAVALSAATGQPADTALVREYRSRMGISFNAEQQINDTLALFARGGIVDGNVEPFDFTDIDRTLAAGLVLQGKHWGRPDDVFGFAGVMNFITSEHKAYFNAGGMGIVVGDGILPNAGPEFIMETYYAFPIAGMTATVDYQFVNNPGYNEDRGPASIFAGRLHAEF
ncbi:carbohydrate porin [Hyphomicrobium sp. D-2]|uniref:carbohydrate porin n=1 Tax=Hyphomicrobium sp. D-2 TaxID=3041621 RepID=UPI002455ACD5|nr:carbohydrate porin [Hyphomicrobium sp. D-2]MDH4981072.1 carbohydrate porin [Hyphomicrobium sp. D-2]